MKDDKDESNSELWQTILQANIHYVVLLNQSTEYFWSQGAVSHLCLKYSIPSTSRGTSSSPYVFSFFVGFQNRNVNFFHPFEKLRDQAKIFFETDFFIFIKNLKWSEIVQMLIKTNHDIVTSTRKNFDPATEKVRPEGGVDAPSNTWGLREQSP